MNVNVSPLTPEGKTQKDTQIKTGAQIKHQNRRETQTDRQAERTQTQRKEIRGGKRQTGQRRQRRRNRDKAEMKEKKKDIEDTDTTETY